MTTKLEGTLRRELVVGRETYTLTISPSGFLFAIKGRRKGLAIAWRDLVSGDAAMATALNASLQMPSERPRSTPPAAKGKSNLRLVAAGEPKQTGTVKRRASTQKLAQAGADSGKNGGKGAIGGAKRVRQHAKMT